MGDVAQTSWLTKSCALLCVARGGRWSLSHRSHCRRARQPRGILLGWSVLSWQWCMHNNRYFGKSARCDCDENILPTHSNPIPSNLRSYTHRPPQSLTILFSRTLKAPTTTPCGIVCSAGTLGSILARVALSCLEGEATACSRNQCLHAGGEWVSW